jgi:hypothetical protein
VTRDADTHVHNTHPKQHFGAAVSVSKDYVAVGCPRCNGVNKCGGRCLDGTHCGRCNATTTDACIADVDCPTDEYCQVNRCQNGAYCSLWSLEQGAGKAFVYKHTGSNEWKYINEVPCPPRPSPPPPPTALRSRDAGVRAQVVPQPTGGFDELGFWKNGGRYCGNRAQGVCGTDGTVVCTSDADCDTAGGICQGGSNGGNACTADAQCPGSGVCSSACGGAPHPAASARRGGRAAGEAGPLRAAAQCGALTGAGARAAQARTSTRCTGRAAGTGRTSALRSRCFTTRARTTTYSPSARWATGRL